MKNSKGNVDRLVLILLCLFNISSLFLGFMFNKILFVLIIAILLFALLDYKIPIKSLLIISLLLIDIFLDIYITRGNFVNLNDVFYLPLWVVLFLYFNERGPYFSKQVKSNQIYIKFTVVGWHITLCFFVAVNHQYLQQGLHRLASSAFMLLCLIWVWKQCNGRNVIYLWASLPIVTIMAAESRTYLGMFVGMLVVIYYSNCKHKSTFIFTVIPFLLLVVFLVYNTSLGQRFTVTSVGNLNTVDSWTSGRTFFWQADIKAIEVAPWINKMFGLGYNEIYNINSSIFAKIYAHNDFINIAVANGFIGLGIYFLVAINYFNHCRKEYQIEGFVQVLIISVFFLNAMFNGQYNYPAATFAIPFVYNGFYIKKINQMGGKDEI